MRRTIWMMSVSLDAEIPDPVPAQLFFRDPDGNRFLLVQSG